MEQEFSFNPEIDLEPQEVADLASITSQPGFKVLLKIHRTCVDWFVKQWLNVDPNDKEKVLSCHMQAKTAAQLYTLLVNNVNNAVHEYIHSRPSDKPVESAEGLDLGEIATGEEDLLV